MRIQGTTRQGYRFDNATIVAVWNKASAVLGKDPCFVRRDACGAIIEFNRYGDTTHLGTGWEIDHIVPVSAGGSDSLFNLQPLQWQNNRAKGDGPLACPVVAAA